MQLENRAWTNDESTWLVESTSMLWSPGGFTFSIRLLWCRWKARGRFEDICVWSLHVSVRNLYSLSTPVVVQLCQKNVLKRNKKKRNNSVSNKSWVGLHNSHSPLPGCCGRSVSSSDVISHNITLGYHQLQCRSPASREQRWAANTERIQLEGVMDLTHHQVAVEVRLPGHLLVASQHSFLYLARSHIYIRDKLFWANLHLMFT